MSDEFTPPERQIGQIDRRELMKIGAGIAAAVGVGAPMAAAQEMAQGGEENRPGAAPHTMRKSGEIAPFTGPGYVNNANRLGGNGPMDDTTAKIVKFAREYDESKITPSAMAWVNRTMVDSMAALVAGFELEEPRILAKLARDLYAPAKETSTILGYGVSTNPEMASVVNSVLIRCTDFNDNIGRSANHVSTLIPAALSMGEALHCTGKQVAAAIIIGYELTGTPTGSDSVASAVMAAKLMGLDEDRMANAISMALIPHVPLNKGVGAMSMWKNVRESEPVRCGVWGALMARGGLTGNPQPFEGRGAYWAYQRRTTVPEFNLPVRSDAMIIEWNHWFKRRPAEAGSQGILMMLPEVRSWVKPEDIAHIHFDMGDWEEIGDAPKWDPRNRQTADHSLPYIIARALLDGDIYLDSYSEEKFMDPKARELMNKTTLAPVFSGWTGIGAGRLTITKNSGETKYWDTYGGNRMPGMPEFKPLNDAELKEKFDRACNYQKMAPAQRDQAYKILSRLEDVKDFADAMKVLANFGQPKPL